MGVLEVLAVAGVASAVGSTVVGANAASDQADAQRDAAGKPVKSEEIVHPYPVETGAKTVQGHDLAAQFAAMQQEINKILSTINPNYRGDQVVETGQQGLDTVVATSDLGGSNREAEFSSYDMLRQVREAQSLKIRTLGIDDGSGSNPYGLKMSYDEFVKLRSSKDPSVLVKEGTSVGDPIKDNEWMGVINSSSLRKASNEQGDEMWTKRFKFLKMLYDDPQMNGDVIRGMQANPEYADSISFWMKNGVLSDQLVQNSGQIKRHMDEFNKNLVSSRTTNAVSPEDEQKLRDEYNNAVAKKVDPKLIKQTNLGGGLMRTTLYNPDGSVAGNLLEGNITLPNGQVMPAVDIIGSTNADFYKFQQKVDATKPLFAQKQAPQGAAPKTQGVPGAPKGAAPAGGAGGMPGMESMMPALAMLMATNPQMAQLLIPMLMAGGMGGAGGAVPGMPTGEGGDIPIPETPGDPVVQEGAGGLPAPAGVKGSPRPSAKGDIPIPDTYIPNAPQPQYPGVTPQV